MILLIALFVAIVWLASSLGAPMPLAMVAGLVLPFVGSSLYLRLSKQDAPMNKLAPGDPRTGRFLSMLVARYRDQGFDEGVASLERISRDYEAGRWTEASDRFRHLTSTVARSPYATLLIGIWQAAWRDASTPDNRRVSMRSPQPVPARINASHATPEPNAVVEPAASDGPWTAANAERDAGLLLRAVLYSLVTPTVPASAQGYASVIAKTVNDGDQKALLFLLSGVNYFLSRVHFLRGDPFEDPAYLPYARLVAAHFMNAATSCLPGPNAPADKIRVANAGRLAAEISGPSMALVEAFGAVGSSAIESASRRAAPRRKQSRNGLAAHEG